MRIRLREKYAPEQLAAVYKDIKYYNDSFDHCARVQSSIGLIKILPKLSSVADLSAGDATIINAVDAPTKYIGDYVPKYEFSGSLEDNIHQIPKVDLFICSETLEHLDNPDAALAQIRDKTKYLLLSTPNGENNQENPEHYWGWDTNDIKEMLEVAGFTPMVLSKVSFFEARYCYEFQIWLAQ